MWCCKHCAMHCGCRFYDAVSSQPTWLFMQRNSVLWTGHCLALFGTMLVATSYWALGFYGTFLGMTFCQLSDCRRFCRFVFLFFLILYGAPATSLMWYCHLNQYIVTYLLISSCLIIIMLRGNSFCSAISNTWASVILLLFARRQHYDASDFSDGNLVKVIQGQTESRRECNIRCIFTVIMLVMWPGLTSKRIVETNNFRAVLGFCWASSILGLLNPGF